MMSAGDLKGCLRKLDAQLRALKYPREVDYNGLAKGDPSAVLPIVSYAFVSYSPHLAEHLVGFGVELTGKNDLRFIECIYKVLRDLFHYKPVLTKQQFLQFGFAERKTCILCDVIAFALQKHKELSKGNKLSLSRPLVERHIGGGSWVSSSRASDDEESQEEEEEGLGLEEFQKPSTYSPSDTLEAQLLQVQTRLERLSALEQRLELLEKASAGRITIDKHQWENLECRVLLLETRLTLSTATAQESSSLVSGGWSHHMTDNATESQDTVLQRASYTPLAVSVLSPPPIPLAIPSAPVMKDTSSLLRSIEPSM
ncbi:unnamed protein product [Coregonus sp. 'balchen']|nr:unnamed protein product [Coregonus sp. 'balchen']